jgi:hypothetical protein
VLQRLLLSALILVPACSDSDSMPDADELELDTNRGSYERIPGVPAPPLTLTLHNRSSSDITVVVCNQAGTPTALIHYQQRQPDNTWADIPFGTVACDAPGAPEAVASGSAWVVPPELQQFPADSGTYRIVLSPDNSSVDFPIVSNSFTVVGGFEGTS